MKKEWLNESAFTKLILIPVFCFLSLQIFSSSFEQAKKHPISLNKPAVDFFEGAILGNGGLGVIVCTRPDAVVLRFGHNNVWDFRISEENKDKIGTFKEIFDRIKQIPDTLDRLWQDKWFDKYYKLTQENYNKPYPRPYPCGSAIFGFDRREIELLGHTLDISNGLCTVKLLRRSDNAILLLKIFVNLKTDYVYLALTDSNNQPVKNIFNRLKLVPDCSIPKELRVTKEDLNKEKGILSFYQTLPYQDTSYYDKNIAMTKDKAIRLSVYLEDKLTITQRVNWEGNFAPIGSFLEYAIEKNNYFTTLIRFDEGNIQKVPKELPEEAAFKSVQFNSELAKNTILWENYWNKSAVYLDDSFLEQIWYRNSYFLNCALKPGITAPGLFGNWSYDNIGTAWHGDYHMNYNTQQLYWAVFSSNHAEKHLPYADLVNNILMPVSKKWAKEYYGLRGAYFPHSAYPVEMTTHPFPAPDWGWEICETPWTVQSLWWHYKYTLDTAFLSQNAYIPIKEAVIFLVDYLKRPEAHGKQWGDNSYHVFPTVAPELYRLKPGFKLNNDCSVDITLIKFVFKAFIEASEVLKKTKENITLIADVKDILKNLPDYSIVKTEKYGNIMVCVPGEKPEVVYNTPNALIPVFPGEEFGLHSSADTFNILKNTFNNQKNEGGNDIVFQHIQAARLGLLDLERFKRAVNYCLLPDGTATDMALQTQGRYNDDSKFDYMAPMGIWVENFALPAVINECLMQSYNGIIRLFPNWPKNKNAKFTDLRAMNAFLVSASLENGIIKDVKILSEKGSILKLYNIWESEVTIETNNKSEKIKNKIITVETKPNQIIKINSTDLH